MKNPLANILLGTALVGTVACNNPLESKLETSPCDTSCTIVLDKFDGQNLPTEIYIERVMADTIWINRGDFHRQYTLLITWPNTPIKLMIQQWYDGKITRREGNEIDLFWEYERVIDGVYVPDTNMIRGVFNKDKMFARQDSVYNGASTLLYDNRGLFEYAVLPFNTPKPDHTNCVGFCW